MSDTTFVRLSPAVTVRSLNVDDVRLVAKNVGLTLAAPGAEAFIQRLIDGLDLNHDFLRECSVPQIRLLRALEERRLLIRESCNPFAGEVFEKQYGYWALGNSDPSQLQRSLLEKTVAVLGVGGVGATVLSHLVGAGVQHFWLVDSDVVEQSNFNRQFIYNTTHLGQPKVVAAAAYVRERIARATVVTRQLEITRIADLKAVFDDARPDILVCAADRPVEIDRIVADYCANAALPYVACGVSLLGGYVEVHSHPAQSVQEKTAAVTTQSRLLSGGIYSHGPTNTIVSAYVADAVLHCLMHPGERAPGRRVHINVEAQADIVLGRAEANTSKGELA